MFLQPRIPKHNEIIGTIDDICTDPFASEDSSSKRAMKLQQLIGSLHSQSFDSFVYKAAIAMGRLYEHFDMLAELEKMRASQAGINISCAPGCAYCCYQPISINFAELFIISEFAQEKNSLLERFTTNYRAWRLSIGDINRFVAMFNAAIATPSAKDRTELISNAVHEFYPKDIACPLLEGNLCSIYPARPISCRAAFSADNPEKCRRNELTGLFYSENINTFASAIFSQVAYVISSSIRIDRLTLAPMPVLLHDFSKHGKKYVESYAEQLRQLK